MASPVLQPRERERERGREESARTVAEVPLTNNLVLALFLELGTGHLQQSRADWVLVRQILIGWIDNYLH